MLQINLSKTMYISPVFFRTFQVQEWNINIPYSEILGVFKNQLKNKWGDSVADTDSVSGEQNLCAVERWGVQKQDSSSFSQTPSQFLTELQFQKQADLSIPGQLCFSSPSLLCFKTRESMEKVPGGLCQPHRGEHQMRTREIFPTALPQPERNRAA